ncbi:MAG: type II toxin-antitoxin system RelE family toxin [Symbiobacteriia bacterium]
MAQKVIFHPAIASEDLPKLHRQFPDRGRQILRQIHAAISEIIAGIGVPQSDMEPPYKGWYRKKFLSSTRPSLGSRADLRLIYQFSDDHSELRVLAVGRRLPGDPDDVYAVHVTRPQSFG